MKKTTLSGWQVLDQGLHLVTRFDGSTTNQQLTAIIWEAPLGWLVISNSALNLELPDELTCVINRHRGAAVVTLLALTNQLGDTS